MCQGTDRASSRAPAQVRGDGSPVKAYRVPSPRRHRLWPSLCGVGRPCPARGAARFDKGGVQHRYQAAKPQIGQLPASRKSLSSSAVTERGCGNGDPPTSGQSQGHSTRRPTQGRAIGRHSGRVGSKSRCPRIRSRPTPFHAVASRPAIDMAEQHPAPLPPALRSAARPRNAYAAHASATRIGARLSRNWRALASQVKREA
jgi:hypothetical protein